MSGARISPLRGLLLVMAAVVALLVAIPPAMAVEVHPRAWASAAFLRAGPGGHYPVVGVLRAGDRNEVGRCQGDWCHVTIGGTSGWVHAAYLGDDGRIPGPFSGPRVDVGRGGPGRVCFHEGENFTGATVCHPSGFVASDLAHHGLDDRFRSITVEGNVSAQVCRDAHFQSYCALYVRSTPRLPLVLRGQVSSYRIW